METFCEVASSDDEEEGEAGSLYTRQGLVGRLPEPEHSLNNS